MQRFKFTMGVLILMLGLTKPTAATLVVGYNDVLDGLSNGFYIPLKPQTSGILGEPLGGGKYVGQHSDTVTLSGSSSSTGYTDFILNFDITVLDPGEEISLYDSTLAITLDDIDFKPTITTKWDFSESMELTYADKTPLIINNLNYGNYTGGYGFGATNNQTVIYTIGLTDLGITQNELDEINLSGQLDLKVRFDTYVTHTSFYCRIDSISNTSEMCGFVLNPVPEPATIILLGIGALATFTRKRRFTKQISK